MKSRSLLPGRDDTEPDEEFIGWEERDVLLARLLELRTYAALSDAFAPNARVVLVSFSQKSSSASAPA